METVDKSSQAGQSPLGAAGNHHEASERWSKGCWILVFAVAVAVGIPSLRCGFIGGDDVQLIRDHVLVNRPSLEHSILLFKPDANRDLYQPIPLLTFAMNFAIVQGLGLTGGDVESPPGAWVFHLTNVLIHAFSALCVFWLLTRLVGSRAVPLVAALLFAVHPFQVESIAWLNGRMMMLSTLFILLGLISFDAWLTRKRWWLAGLVLLFVVLSLMSKVRPCMPGLFLLIPLWRRQWPCWRTWGIWLIIAGLVGFSIWLNINLSSIILEKGLEVVGGNPIVRGTLGLAWYIQHAVVPLGLAAWHPLPEGASWSTPGAIYSASLIVLLLLAVGISLRFGKTGLFGLGWFLIAIIVLLPILPSRNQLAADRYTYLAGIGFYWMAAALFVWLCRKFEDSGYRTGVYLLRGVGVCVLIVFFTLSVFHIPHYKDTPTRQLRIAMMHPDAPGVWGHVGKAYYSIGDYENALKYAQKELALNADSKMSRVGHLAGMSLFRLGKVEEGIEWIQKSIDANPDEGMGWLKLAVVYNETGRTDEAIKTYEEAVHRMPVYIPALESLAQLYLKQQRYADAQSYFEKVLKINRFHVGAGIGMAQIEMASGQFAEAAERLTVIVQLAPYRSDAWTNLGVCYAMMNKVPQATTAYEQALAVDPSASTAALNLAVLRANRGDIPGAAVLLSKIPDMGSDHPPAMGLVIQVMAELATNLPQQADKTTRRLLSMVNPNPADAPDQLLAMLQRYAGQHPDNPFSIYLASMVLAHQGQMDAARAGIDLFKSQCNDPQWRKRADEILAGR